MQPNDRIHFRDGYFDHIMRVLALGKATKAEQRDMAKKLEEVFAKVEGFERPSDDDVLSEAQRILRNGRYDSVSSDIANARNALNGSVG